MKRNFKVDNKDNNGSIKVRISNPFSWLPNSLVSDPNVSAEVLAVALYLNRKRGDFHVTHSNIKERFGWGDKKWQAIFEEMISLEIIGHDQKIKED